MTDQERRAENNELIDHLSAALKIVKTKCGRCDANGCMGCTLDGFDRGMIPANIERAIRLMSGMPNDRHEVVDQADSSVQTREAEWRKLMEKK